MYRWLAVGLIVMSGVGCDPAQARGRHRHHSHRAGHIPHRFVFGSPAAAARVAEVGAYDGEESVGIPGPTTADPYQHPASGYDASGRYGPGFIYPGY